MSKLHTILIIFAFLIPIGILAQTKEKKKSTNIIVIDDINNNAMIGFPNAKLELNEHNDTIAKITIGRRRWEFIENHDDTKVRMVKVLRNKFKGHWAGVQLGFNNYHESDQVDFMNLNSGKSMTVGINFLQYNIDLRKDKTNFGLVTGLGWAVYNYRFDNDYLIVQQDGLTIGQPTEDRHVKKSKIVTSYLNIPLLLELQTPENSNVHAFVSAGLYGGFRLGSHTKTVYFGDDKKKSRQDININPFQYGAMFQVGFNIIKLYGTYNFSSLFESNKGPEVTPYTVGLTLINF
ncbi:porin family protein [Saccharicrinis fermentans]|uniref:Outer membrane protein beta-barrel domain-containing protein n=1 Tax=Saccharicrinis fermentans DSM 9555 = JCM 21142 TaxID=869213 RepID=W7YJJ0_9BACT|nr:porin family protein [Saccharicrinis fermentans]GAF04691.1 hypothetical protein JCM21142_93406 [Saccharicrinis fermentans DSM 9555 = JCM 21142]